MDATSLPFRLRSELLQEVHRSPLVSMLEHDEALGLGWGFRDYPTPEDNVERLFEVHNTTGVSWAFMREGRAVAYLSVYMRRTDQFEGFSTKTYIAGSCRGRGLNGLLKSQLVDSFRRNKLPLFSRVSVRNERSLLATMKTTRDLPDCHKGVFEGIHIFELSKGVLEEENLPKAISLISDTSFAPPFGESLQNPERTVTSISL